MTPSVSADTLNVPHDQFAARLAELPSGTDIFAYCRGCYCVFASDAVRLLRARGFPARPLDGGLGWPDCRSPPQPTHVPAAKDHDVSQQLDNAARVQVVLINTVR